MTEESPGRGKSGRFERTLAGAEKDAEAARLRAMGLSLRQIAEQLGYAGDSGAYKAIQRALAAVPADSVEELRRLQMDQLDHLTRAAVEILQRDHPLVAAGGRIATGPDGRPVLDPRPKLHAIETLLRIAERRARLMGLDAPTKLQWFTLSQLDARIDELLAEMPDLDPEAFGRVRRRAIEGGGAVGQGGTDGGSSD